MNGVELAHKKYGRWEYDYRLAAVEFVYRAMGFDGVLSDELLNYVNEETRLGLEPDGVRQYAYKMVDE